MTSAPLIRLASLPTQEAPLPEGIAAWVWKLEKLLEPRWWSGMPLRLLSRRAHRMAAALEGLSDAALDARINAQHMAIRRQGEIRLPALCAAMALLSEAAARTTGMRPYPVQLQGAMALQSGCLVEMQTGEGKSLTACMAAALAAWTGKPCHVMTANTYLAQRDANSFTPFFARCGLSVAAIADADPEDLRRQSYAADVVYATAKELLADLLRDAIRMGPKPTATALGLGFLSEGPTDEGPLLRGLTTAIVDEADSLLIDDAVTPLIIANEKPIPGFNEAIAVAVDLLPEWDIDTHIRLDYRLRRAELTERGVSHLATRLALFQPPWSDLARAAHLVGLALTAQLMLTPGRHFVVEEGKVILLDEQTGRRADGRILSEGLHQALEIHQGLEPSPQTEIAGRRSFQRFFRLYPRLSGLTGTAAEAASEFWAIYGLPVIRMRTHRPGRRQRLPTMLLPDEAAKFAAVADEAASLAATGRPVLVGTRGIASAEAVAALLRKKGLTPRLLTAQDESIEADAIARAGQPGVITVATNMAGRGTDIHLAPGVARAGGLHVAIAEANDLSRIDRQMAGRAARQGDPGSARIFLAPGDIVFQRSFSQRAQRLLAAMARRHRLLASMAGVLALRLAQGSAARLGASIRRGVLASDLQFEGSGL